MKVLRFYWRSIFMAHCLIISFRQIGASIAIGVLAARCHFLRYIIFADLYRNAIRRAMAEMFQNCRAGL